MSTSGRICRAQVRQRPVPFLPNESYAKCIRTRQHVGKRVEHGLRVQAGGQRLVLRREGREGILPPGGKLPADDRVQLCGLLRSAAMQMKSNQPSPALLMRAHIPDVSRCC